MATWRVLEPADSTDVPVGASYIRENNTQIEAVCSATRLAAGTLIHDVFSTGGVVKSWFYQASAPSYWTEIASLGDTLLGVKGGSTYTTSGTTAGTWQLPSHTLIESEVPAHTHTMTIYKTYSAGAGGTAPRVLPGGSTTTSSYGGGGSHNHGLTWRPAARIGLICSLD